MGYKDLTRQTHGAFCNWLQDRGPEIGKRRKLGLMPRGHFKTTIDMADCVRLLAINPNERILRVAESALNAESMLREIQGHFMGNQVLAAFFPEIIPADFNKTTWTRNAMIIPRPYQNREPSIEAAGITSKLVSRHYTIIKCDDLVSDEAMYSPQVMDKAVAFVNRLVSLLTNPREDDIHIIGTRWAYYDIYQHIIDEMPEFDVFIRKAIIRDPETGEEVPFFPQRYTMEDFAGIIKRDPAQWATQYANDPHDTSVADFRKEWLQYFRFGPDRNIRYNDDENRLHMVETGSLRTYIHVDPSRGETPHSDYTGIVVIGVAPDERIFVLDAWTGRVDGLQLSNKILELSSHWHPSLVSIERNGFYAFKSFLDAEARRRGMYIRTDDPPAPRGLKKHARIRGALQPLFATGQIWIREGLVELIEEYLRFGKSKHEHLLDAMAQGPTENYWKRPMGDAMLSRYAKLKAKMGVDRGVTGYGI